MDQSRTLACEVVDCGMVVKECDTWRPRVCWTLGRYSAAGRAEEEVVVGVELGWSLGKEGTGDSPIRTWARETRRMCDTTAEVIDAMEALSY